jgi:hypothetical protein
MFDDPTFMDITGTGAPPSAPSAATPSGEVVHPAVAETLDQSAAATLAGRAGRRMSAIAVDGGHDAAAAAASAAVDLAGKGKTKGIAAARKARGVGGKIGRRMSAAAGNVASTMAAAAAANPAAGPGAPLWEEAQGGAAAAAASAPVTPPVEAELVSATENTETPPTAEVQAALQAAFAVASAEEADAIAAWLARRLTDGMGELTGSIPISLKAVNVMASMVVASPACAYAVYARCMEPLTAAAAFSRADPVHGDKPAGLVRKKAGSIIASLEASKHQPKSSKVGGLAAKAYSKSSAAAHRAQAAAQQKMAQAQQAAKDGTLLSSVQTYSAGVAAKTVAAASTVGSGVVSKAAAVRADLA